MDVPLARPSLAEAAAHAAESAGVVIRLVHDLPHLAAVEQLWSDTWFPGTDASPVNRDLMRAMTYAGSYLGAAFDGGRLVGASLGFFSAPGDRHLHSHLAAVAADVRGRHVGLALKLHQRAWARTQGATRVTWTVDPLVRRNAHFNIAKLGAGVAAYHVDFYGLMDDGINAGQGSDRLLMSWPSVEPSLPAPGSAEPSGATPLLWQDHGERPVTGPRPAIGDVALVQVPADVERLRVTDPGLGRSWRAAVRDVLHGLLQDGWTITGFTRTGSYVLEHAREVRP